jgi:hypothetical protein
MTRAVWFHPYTGEPRTLAEVAADPEALACVDVHGPVRARARRDPARLTTDRALTSASYAHLGHVSQYAEGWRFGVLPWFYGWAVQRAFIAGALWQRSRPIEESETCRPGP